MQAIDVARYTKCVEVSKRIRWDIERDVIRGRSFDFEAKFLPDGLSMIDRLGFLAAAEKRLVSQVQGRTYANMIALFERFIGAKMLEVSRGHAFGEQSALEALVRFTDEELKHQALFRRVESMLADGMPAGYRFVPQPNVVAAAVLEASTWAVLGLTCLIELFTQAHYRSSIGLDLGLSELWKDVFLFHWKDEAQHAILDEMEWQREHAKLHLAARDRAVDDLIELIAVIDRVLQVQATADADYFVRACGRPLDPMQAQAVGAAFLAAYRWQYIVSGFEQSRFQRILGAMITPVQAARMTEALAPIIGSAIGPIATPFPAPKQAVA